ncbi:MAG: LPS export ABC transporter permease LptF [Pseudazoarcus pumilus]|nr:LPS export ABC transporter permease LptF [Pseudazoarcus pumilus]
MIFRTAILKEFRNTALALFVALFAILISVVLIRMLGQAAGGRVPADAVMALIGFGALAQLPIVLSLTLFVAVLVTLSRYYRDSEMVVWFSAGLPLTAFISPVMRFAMPMTILIAALTLFITPWANNQSEVFRAELDNRDDTTRVTPGVFRESADGQRVFFVESGSDEDGRLRNVFVSSMVGGNVSVIASEEGIIESDERGDRFLVLLNGRRYDGEPGSASYRVMEFDAYRVLIDQRRTATPTVRTRTTSTVDLLSLRTPRALGELSSRINLPLAALLLAFLAIPLSFVNPRAGRGSNLIIAVLAYLVYSNAINIGDAWVAQRKIGFWLATILPHLIVLGLLAVLFYRRLALSPFWRARA